MYFRGRRRQVPLGIEANLEKCIAILEIWILTNIQEVQLLNGKLAFLSRFLSKLLEKENPFYKQLKKIEPFLWDETCEQAFLAFKKTIVTSSGVNRPRARAPLLLYLSVAWRWDVLPNDKKGGVNTHYLGLTT